MKIERIYAIDTTGKYPIALIRYADCSPHMKLTVIKKYLNIYRRCFYV
jgi:hypothetical protein